MDKTNITVERLKFYADTDTQKNKYFVFKINSIVDLPERLKYWSERVYIRSAYYEAIENGTVIQNEKIDLVDFTDNKNLSFIR